MYIPYNIATIGDEEINEVIETLKSGWLTMGPKTFQFECDLAKYSNTEHVVAVSSCTAALHLSLLAYDIGHGDEVITTPYTFAATGNSILYTGAKPVFVDIQKESFNINHELIEDAITDNTKAIIPVDFAGQPCEYDAINDIAYDHDLVVISDAAHSLGAKYKGKSVGNLADATCTSFYATKNITTGEGGAIFTNDDSIVDKLKCMRLHGISKDAWKRYAKSGDWRYDIGSLGWKYNMTDIQSSIGIHQLKKLDTFCDLRIQHANMFSKLLFDMNDELHIFKELPNRNHVFHLFPILLNNYDRDEFIKEMNDVYGIGCSVHFIPLHHHTLYNHLHYDDLNNADFMFEREVSLPLYPSMTNENILYICKCIKDILC